MMVDFTSLYNLAIAALCIIPLVISLWTIYSVYFGPLSKFPGPKLAAATLWYEFYYDVVLQGQYTFKIKELHGQYGTSEDATPLSFAGLMAVRPHYPNQSL